MPFVLASLVAGGIVAALLAAPYGIAAAAVAAPFGASASAGAVAIGLAARSALLGRRVRAARRIADR